MNLTKAAVRYNDEVLLAHIRAIYAQQVKGEYGCPRMRKELLA